ncbi:MAG: DUF3320 domain-containing protein [Planctomycetes bacterium]|nr:DUF3320 domain-containing protein [Planctomycetota bacterium]
MESPRHYILNDQSSGDRTSIGPLRVKVEYDPCIGFATQQNGIALLKSLTIENVGAENVQNVIISIGADPDFASSLELRLAGLAPSAQFTWTRPEIQLRPTFLSGLRERLAGMIYISLTAEGCHQIVEHHPIAVLAYDQWGGLRSLPELLCAFVLPNHPAIVGWLRDAALSLERWSGDPSLSGYQLRSRNRVQLTAAAIFHSIQASGITYVVPPASFERDGQKIRTPDRVREERLATCLDLAAVAAACLEQAGLNSLLIVVKGHAFVGVWLDEMNFPEPTIEDLAILLKRIELGEICVFDPTHVTHRPACSFEEATLAARAHLVDPQEFSCAIDVSRSRIGGIRPLPVRAEGVIIEPDGSLWTGDPQAPEIVLPQRAKEQSKPETPSSRIDRWKRRLLDLTNRNRLLNFVESKKTVPLSCSNLGKLEDILAAGNAVELRRALSEQHEGRSVSRPVNPKTISDLLDSELDAGRLVARLEDEALQVRLTEIFRSAREGLEEGGASGLYLALGFLEWFESASSDRSRRAPLILIPVDLLRGSIRQGFKLTRGADETRFNTTLVEMLSAQFHIQIPGIDPLPEDEQGIDVLAVLQEVRSALKNVPRWRIHEEAYLGFFTFSKFLMWKDLDKQSEVLLQNRIVSHLVNHPDCAFDPDWKAIDHDTLDREYKSSDFCCPVLADSSQLAAVAAASKKRSFVLEGPPGTGKSQTITNLIADSLASGRTVLFVSEKTAALNVVFDRLKKIGLERYCLELHSNKANKAEVIRRLGESLRAAREQLPEEWLRSAESLDRVRSRLNAYAEAVGRKHLNGLSVFQATSLLTALRDSAVLDLEWSGIDNVDRAFLDDCRNILREAQNALGSLGNLPGHPLSGVQIDEASPGLIERIRDCFVRLRKEIECIPNTLLDASQLFSIDIASASAQQLRLLRTICLIARDAPRAGFGLVTIEPKEIDKLVHETCSTGRHRDEIRATLTLQFDVRITELDLSMLQERLRTASSAWLFGRWLRTRLIRRHLSSVTRPGIVPSLRELKLGVESALQLRSLQVKIVPALSELSHQAGASWRDDESPWEEIESSLKWAKSAQATLLQEGADPSSVQRLLTVMARWITASGGPEKLRSSLERFIEAIDRLFEASTVVSNLLRLPGDDPWNAPTEPGRIQSWRERMDRVESALSQLRAWALWRRWRTRMETARLSSLVRALEHGRIEGSQVVRTFDRSYLEAWLSFARHQEPILRDFLALSHDQEIKQFRALDDHCSKLSSKVICAKLSARVPSANLESVSGSELGVLNRQLQLQRKHLGPRQLFTQARSLVQKLKPCFLMSPISVAQYLPPGAISFDLVIFDEASQIPTWDAVGAIARGHQAIIVGDSRQLPPTTFFDSVIEDEDTESQPLEELESILNECRAANLPSLDLRWHYRSRHESLIAFSNRNYYDNRLSTFPSASFDGLGVQWRHVPDGSYDKGRSRTNRVEAETVVAEVLRRLRDPALAQYSIGIVTFSSAQQRKIEEMLDEERRRDPALDRHFVAREEFRESVFIKNLENVQGDERDVILFSICYGPDESGRIGMNFGPINQEGGERRLNVAITRARRELIVFSTLTSDQIDLARTRSRGVADLKQFLAYAQHGLRVLPSLPSISGEADTFESPLEEEICKALRSRGYTVHSQVGCSGYRVDLAIVDPDRPGRFLVGIECDGANYHSTRSARDRDRLRQSVLEGLGWRLLRVWSSDWWESREEQLERLCSSIESVRAEDLSSARHRDQPQPGSEPISAEPRESNNIVEPIIDPRTVGTVSSIVNMRAPDALLGIAYKARAHSLLGTQEDFYDPSQTRRVQAELLSVIAEEGPISLALAASRVAASFGFERTRRKAVDRIDAIARRLRVHRTQQATGVFFWQSEASAVDWRVFRRSEPGSINVRASSDLPVQEIANAAAELLAVNGACPQLDLLRALARVFGFKALSKSISDHLANGVELLLATNRARLDNQDRIELIQ